VHVNVRITNMYNVHKQVGTQPGGRSAAATCSPPG